MRKITRHPVLLDQQVEEVGEQRIGAAQRARRARRASRRVEKYGEKRKTCRSWLASIASASWPSCSCTTSSRPARGPPRAAPGRRRRRSPPRASPSSPRSAPRSRARRAPPRRGAAGRRRSASCASPSRPRGPSALATSSRICADRAARLGLDVAPGLLEQLLAALARLHRRPRARRPRRCAARGATISSACSRASLRRSRYSARSSSASWRVRSARVDRVLDRLLAAVEGGADRRERELGEQEHRDPEHEQRPDHQPPGGGDQELARTTRLRARVS